MTGTRKQPGETKCWTCRRSGGPPETQCQWFLRHRPVPGWTAVRRDVLMQSAAHKRGKVHYYRNYEESYRVIDCPLYLEDRKEPPKQPGWDGPYWDAPCCMECYSRKTCMEVKGTCNRREKC